MYLLTLCRLSNYSEAESKTGSHRDGFRGDLMHAAPAFPRGSALLSNSMRIVTASPAAMRCISWDCLVRMLLDGFAPGTCHKRR